MNIPADAFGLFVFVRLHLPEFFVSVDFFGQNARKT
jgi:hypothetical protein